MLVLGLAPDKRGEAEPEDRHYVNESHEARSGALPIVISFEGDQKRQDRFCEDYPYCDGHKCTRILQPVGVTGCVCPSATILAQFVLNVKQFWTLK